MPWKCPECENEISSLCYAVSTSGREYGSANLTERNQNGTSRVIEYNCDDSESGDWSDDIKYTCPECSDDLNIDDLEWRDEEEEEEEIKEKTITEEETTHEIVKPKNNIICNERPSDYQTSIICKKCFHLFVTDETDGEKFYQCPQCGENISSTEFHELLKTGYYSKNHVNKHK